MADSPNELHIIDGVDESNHAVYCRDGLRLLLECCPDIDGVTLTTHYEGGIPEPSDASTALNPLVYSRSAR